MAGPRPSPSPTRILRLWRAEGEAGRCERCEVLELIRSEFAKEIRRLKNAGDLEETAGEFLVKIAAAGGLKP